MRELMFYLIFLSWLAFDTNTAMEPDEQPNIQQTMPDDRDADIKTDFAPPPLPVKPILQDASVIKTGICDHISRYGIQTNYYEQFNVLREQKEFLEELGHTTCIVPVKINGKTGYRLCIMGFASREEAEFYKEEYGFTANNEMVKTRAKLLEFSPVISLDT